MIRPTVRDVLVPAAYTIRIPGVDRLTDELLFAIRGATSAGWQRERRASARPSASGQITPRFTTT